MSKRYLATSERAYRRSDEVRNTFTLKDESLQVGDKFEFEGIDWTVDEVLDTLESKIVSRRYLKEKWNRAKSDIEQVLDIYNDELPDLIDQDDLDRVIYNIRDSLNAILNELR